jgi:hypothetical protein
VQKETRIHQGERVSVVKEDERPINRKIAELIRYKQDLKDKGEPYEVRKIVQDEIDKLMKKREAKRNAALFREWKDRTR